jgi:hypothetical protein
MIAIGVPITIGADDARQAAQRELSKRIYHTQDRPWAERLMSAIFRWVGHVIDRAAGASPGGAVGLLLIVLTVVVILVALRVGVGPLARAARVTSPVFEEKDRTADDYRALADEYAAAGDFSAAVRERFRATVRELEQRGVLEPRAGRTADEAAAEAGRVLPALGADLHAGARAFDDVSYGGKTAGASTDAGLRSLHQQVRAARITLPS